MTKVPRAWRSRMVPLLALGLTIVMVPAALYAAASDGPYVGYLRGVAVAGGSFNDGRHSSGAMTASSPGTYGIDWFYDVDGERRTDETGMAYLASRGIELIRVDFRWERLQPELNGPLQADEVARITAMLDAAARHGLKVVLDCHNYGHYKADDAPALESAQGGWSLGEDELPYSAFADLWRRVVEEWGAHQAVWGWELMNEPVHMDAPGYPTGVERWQAASQVATEAIRASEPQGQERAVLVGGYEASSVVEWARVNGDPWVDDPLGDPNRLIYVGHHYWDADRSSEYGAETPAFLSGSVDAHAATVVGQLREFTSWLEEHDLRGAVTEVGWPDQAAEDWNVVADAWFAEADAAALHVAVWATGSAWGDYDLAVYEANPGSWSWHGGDVLDTANRQAAVLEAHLSGR